MPGSSMSELTPRTDAEAFGVEVTGPGGAGTDTEFRVDADFARTLERELNAVRGELETVRAERDREAEASKRNFAAIGDYEALRATNAGLLEAFRPVLALYDEFLEGDTNYENAYLCFYKGEYAKWEKARAAIAGAENAESSDLREQPKL